MEDSTPLVPIQNQSLITTLAPNQNRYERILFGIKPFSGKLYNLWKFQTQNMLEQEGLWDVVDPKKHYFSFTESEEQKDKHAGQLLIRCLSFEQLVHITHTKSGRNIWKIFSRQHEGTSVRHKQIARQEYYNAKQNENESITLYMTRVKVATERLSTFVDVSIDENDKCHSVLFGLLPIYSDVVRSLGKLPDEDLDWDMITSTLLQEELTINTTSSESLLLAKGKEKNWKKRFCTCCKKDGHTMEYCYFNPASMNFGKHKTPKLPQSMQVNQEEAGKLMIVEDDVINYLFVAHQGTINQPMSFEAFLWR